MKPMKIHNWSIRSKVEYMYFPLLLARNATLQSRIRSLAMGEGLGSSNGSEKEIIGGRMNSLLFSFVGVSGYTAGQ